MSAAESDLLFINKTARSEKLSRSRGLERARIYSHVQRGCHNQAPRKLSNQDEVLCYPLESWSSEPNKPGSRSHPRPSGGKRSLTRGCKTKMHGEVDSTAGALRTFHISARPLQLGPSNPLNGGAGDPFDSLRVPISPYMEGLLKFYSSDVVPRIFPIKKVANIARVYTLMQAFEDPLQRESLLCTTSAAIYADSGVARHGIAAMTFKGRALANLQNQLSRRTRSREATFSSIYAVALLLYVECLLGNEADLIAHVAGLKQLVDDPDVQLHESPLCIFATLFACSYLGAALLDVVPSLEPVPAMQSSSLSEPAQTALQAVLDGPSPMAPRLFERHTDYLGASLVEVATEQRRVMQFRYLCERGVYDPSPADMQYIYGREMCVEYQLTALRADETLSPAQHAIRLALFIFPQPFILVAKPNAAFCRAMTKRMKQWLDKSDLVGLWAPRCDLLFWILFVTAHISIGEAQWPWLLSYLSTLIKFLGMQSVDEMEEVLQGFYYHPHFFRVTAQKIWAEHKVFVLGNEVPR